MKKLFSFAILVFTLAAVSAVQAATYYIDHTSGSDSNNGSSKSTPWKRHPFMVGWSGTYTHVAGDRFIFKGGVTWPRASLPMRIIGKGGSSDTIRDYYGVDQTWFSGGSWTRPTFNFEHNQIGSGFSGSAGFFLDNSSYITFDYLELKNHRSPQDTSALSFSYGATTFNFTNSHHTIIQNCVVRDWSIALPVGYAAGSGGGFWGYQSGGTKILNCIINQAGVSMKTGNAIWMEVSEIAYCDISEVSIGIMGGGGNIHHNHIHHIRDATDPAAHENAMYIHGITNIHDNVMHDIAAAAMPYYLEPGRSSSSGTLLFYNNVFYNGSSNAPVTIDGNGAANISFKIYNNTLEHSASWCIAYGRPDYVQSIGSLELKNNHMMTTYTSAILAHQTNLGTYNATNNLIQTQTVAASFGATAANNYKPTSASSPTINTGVSLASIFTTDILGATRPTGGGWDIGAYEYGGIPNGNQSPSVSIITPAHNTTYPGPTATIDIAASASDVDSAITKVEFFNGASKLGEDTGAPFTFGWSNVALGDYLLTAKATDSAGATGTSSPIQVSVVAADEMIAGTNSVSNSAFLAVSGAANGQGTGSPYPSTVNLSGMAGVISKVTVQLHALTHPFPRDLDFLLVGPGGQNVMVLSDAGGNHPISDIDLIFDDDAFFPLTTSRIHAGTYKPTNLTRINWFDTFPSPAPAQPYGGELSIFNDTSPNGTWKLFVLDEATSGSGNLGGGWTIDVTTHWAAPIVTTTGATGVTSNSATLNGTINPLGLASIASLNFGTSAAYTDSQLPQNAGSGTTASPVALTLIGLKPGTTYHYQLTGENGVGTSNGADMTFTTAPFLDSDGDGIPNDYETANSFNPNSSTDAALDADGDGATNLQEYLAGTNARSAASVLRIASVQRSVTDFLIAFPTTLGKRYRVQKKDDLLNPTWITLLDNVGGTGQLVTVTDFAATSTASRRIYRVLVLP